VNQGKQRVFLGEYEVSLAPRNRILIPSEFRRNIDPEKDGNKLCVTYIGSNACIYVYSDYMNMTVTHIRPGISPSPELLDWINAKIGQAHEIEMDGQGRVVLPESVVKRVKLDKDLTLVGRVNHISIWNRSAWEAERERLEGRLRDIEKWGGENLKERSAELPKAE